MLTNVLFLTHEQDPLEGLGDPNTVEEEVEYPDPATDLDNDNNSIDEHYGIKSEIIECETIIKEEIEDDYEYSSTTVDS